MECSYRQILFNVYQCQLKAYENVLAYFVFVRQLSFCFVCHLP
jgi:hypothetical protein